MLLQRLRERAEHSGQSPKPEEGVRSNVEAAVANIGQLALHSGEDALLVLDNNGRLGEARSHGPYLDAAEAQAAVRALVSGSGPPAAASRRYVETSDAQLRAGGKSWPWWLGAVCSTWFVRRSGVCSGRRAAPPRPKARDSSEHVHSL